LGFNNLISQYILGACRQLPRAAPGWLAVVGRLHTPPYARAKLLTTIPLRSPNTSKIAQKSSSIINRLPQLALLQTILRSMIKGSSILTSKLWFPPPEAADAEGLLAIGGDLSVERLLLAYRNGIFPWYDGNLPLWWNPDPRFVLFPEELYVSKTMKQVINREVFQFSHNQHFEEVIAHCETTQRPGQDGTWINEDVKDAYTELHRLGYAHSFESIQNGQLVGGLYGIKMGNIFFGESMFSHVSNASKAAFIQAVAYLRQQGVVMIDCQVHTPHLETLGACFISRVDFLEILKEQIPA
jgi:leucyl/phenylalanyl-tRNA--protein transferase